MREERFVFSFRLSRGVMVAQQVLVLFDKVRILAGQQTTESILLVVWYLSLFSLVLVHSLETESSFDLLEWEKSATPYIIKVSIFQGIQYFNVVRLCLYTKKITVALIYKESILILRALFTIFLRLLCGERVVNKPSNSLFRSCLYSSKF